MKHCENRTRPRNMSMEDIERLDAEISSLEKDVIAASEEPQKGQTGV